MYFSSFPCLSYNVCMLVPPVAGASSGLNPVKATITKNVQYFKVIDQTTRRKKQKKHELNKKSKNKHYIHFAPLHPSVRVFLVSSLDQV